ncbi:MAG: DUF4191 domain-containing protein [Propionibacteriaceae bacterium]|nr:DUF4191 domain-containing protein [Propionibacteriaceae bacterium]
MAENLTPRQAYAKAVAEQKAAKKAAKAARKGSKDPNQMGRFRQIAESYKLTAQYDKSLTPLTILCFVVPITISIVIAILTDASLFSWIMTVLTGIMAGLLLAMLLLVNKTKKATYQRYAGEVGSAEVALQMLGKKWVHDPVIAATKHKDVVHRAVGPAGIVLVAEGDPNRARQLLLNEERKHEKFIHNVAIHAIQMGDKEGQVPLSQLEKHVRKLPKALQPHQVTDVRNRLRAIDAVRPKLPMPKGPIPTSMKGMRKGMRGR